MQHNQGVTPQAGSGCQPSASAASSTASSQSGIPNAAATDEMASALRGNVASQHIADAANINYRELAIAAIWHVHNAALEHLRRCTDSSVGSRSDFNLGVTRGLEIATAQIEYGHYLASAIEASGQDGETRLDAKHESTVAKPDAQPTPVSDPISNKGER